MTTVQQYLERGRDWYQNDISGINIWGENFIDKPFDNGDLVIEGFDKVTRIYVCGIFNMCPRPFPGEVGRDENLKIPHLTIKNCSPHLNEICVYRNNTEKITFEGDFSSVLYLDVSGNNLTELDLTPFPNLEKLDIGYNLIENIDLSKCPKLINFECSYNPLQDLDFSNNKDLEYLTLSNSGSGPYIIDFFNGVLEISADKIKKILKQVGKQLTLLNLDLLPGNKNLPLGEITELLNPEKLEELVFTGSLLHNKSQLEPFTKLRSFNLDELDEKVNFLRHISVSEELGKKKKELERQKAELEARLAQGSEEKTALEKQLSDNQRAISSLESQLNQANSKSTKLAQVTQEKAQLLQELTTLKANQANFTSQEYQTKIRELETKLVQVEKEKAAALNNLNNSQQERERDLRTEIQQLEQISNRTPQQKQELINKKAELKKLEGQINSNSNQQENNSNNFLFYSLGMLSLILPYLLYKVCKITLKKFREKKNDR